MSDTCSVVYVSPKCATDMINCLPLLSSSITSGDLSEKGTSSTFVFGDLRYCNEVRPLPCKAAQTIGEVESRLVLIIQPNFRCASTPAPSNVPLACKIKSPFIFFQAN